MLPKPDYERDGIVLYLGDCQDLLAEFPEHYFDSVITDPPYELGFMGKKWDSTGIAFQVETWGSVLRVVKPGAILLAFGGTRTYHRMTCAIEDAGFEIRDCMMWLYGSGFPKSMDISKALDKKAGVEREILSERFTKSGGKASINKTNKEQGFRPNNYNEHGNILTVTAPSTEAAKQWEGWGTSLKPSYEPIVLAMAPLDGTFANNVLKHGCGGLNIDGCRIGTDGATKRSHQAEFQNEGITGSVHATRGYRTGHEIVSLPQGRWPANTLLQHHPECGDKCHPDCPVRLLDEQSGVLKSGGRGSNIVKNTSTRSWKNTSEYVIANNPIEPSVGGASRFFYTAKASKRERGDFNKHPTVKPIAIMKYLCNLTKTPTGGVVLDPFAGSGTTVLACIETGRPCIAIEKDRESFEIMVRRVENALSKPKQLTMQA